MSSETITVLPCSTCGGDGRKWTSRYGGNDPDVYDDGPCPACDGKGDQVCEDCGEHPATVRLSEGRDKFLLCRACAEEWENGDE